MNGDSIMQFQIELRLASCFQNSNYPKNNGKYFPLTKLCQQLNIHTRSDRSVFH